jgi:hypothetical protein
VRALLFAGLVAGCGAKSGLLFGDRDGGLTDDGGVLPPHEPICAAMDGIGETRLEIPFTTRIETADVLFLVDATSSMRDEIDEIRQRLKDTLAPGIAAEIRNVRFAVAYLGDFPVDPFGSNADRPFGLLQEVTGDLDDVEIAVDAIPLLEGGDGPEGQVEALFQSATGQGIGEYVAPTRCTDGRGYPCFRSAASPIVLLFTDAAFHNGPGGSDPYSDISPLPHTYAAAVDALVAIGARVIGLNSGGGFGAEDLSRIASDTGAVGPLGPLVFDIGFRGEELDEGVVESMRTLANEVPLDVSARAQDVPGDEVNAIIFVKSLTALRAEPPEGVASFAETTFRQVKPGTTVVFELVIDETAVPRQPHVREHWLRIVLVGEGDTPLAEQDVIIRISGTEEDADCP